MGRADHSELCRPLAADTWTWQHVYAGRHRIRMQAVASRRNWLSALGEMHAQHAYHKLRFTKAEWNPRALTASAATVRLSYLLLLTAHLTLPAMLQ